LHHFHARTRAELKNKSTSSNGNAVVFLVCQMTDVVEFNWIPREPFDEETAGGRSEHLDVNCGYSR
jgi:hypothetical protein